MQGEKSFLLQKKFVCPCQNDKWQGVKKVEFLSPCHFHKEKNVKHFSSSDYFHNEKKMEDNFYINIQELININISADGHVIIFV